MISSFIIQSVVSMDPDHLSSYWGDVLDGLGLPHVRFPRHSDMFATRAIEQGIDVATVSGILGHADTTTTTHYYVHPRDASMRRAMAGSHTGRSSYARMAEYPIICTEKR